MKPWKPWALEVYHHHDNNDVCRAYATCIGAGIWKPVHAPRFQSLTGMIKHCNTQEKRQFFQDHELWATYRIRNTKTNETIPIEALGL